MGPLPPDGLMDILYVFGVRQLVL